MDTSQRDRLTEPSVADETSSTEYSKREDALNKPGGSLCHLACLGKLMVPMIVASQEGRISGFTAPARALLTRMGVPVYSDAPLPSGLWSSLQKEPPGEAISWRPGMSSFAHMCLGCSRYETGTGHWLVLLSEVTDKHKTFIRHMQRERGELMRGLVASIAHELRSPLTTILCVAEQLERDLADQPAASKLEHVLASVRSMDASIRRLLNFTHGDGATKCNTDMNLLLEDIIARYRPRIRAGGHTVHFVRPKFSRPFRVHINVLSIEQAISTLISNALESRGGEAVQVRIRLDRSQHWIHVFVHDDGEGIDEPVRDRIFEPFSSGKADGVGLGLALAQDVVRREGGTLNLLPSQEGAIFELRLPPTYVDAPDEPLEP